MSKTFLHGATLIIGCTAWFAIANWTISRFITPLTIWANSVVIFTIFRFSTSIHTGASIYILITEWLLIRAVAIITALRSTCVVNRIVLLAWQRTFQGPHWFICAIYVGWPVTYWALRILFCRVEEKSIFRTRVGRTWRAFEQAGAVICLALPKSAAIENMWDVVGLTIALIHPMLALCL
jgi:hypothetical protein